MTKKKFRTKLTAMGLSVALAATVLTGCGSSSNLLSSSKRSIGTTTASKSEYTVYEALHNDDFKIWYSVSAEDRNKDSYPTAIYLVENGACTWISPDVKAQLEFSELAKMTDDEIIQYCKEHPYTAENSWHYDSQEDVDKKWWVPKQMKFTALTDGTGNNTAKENVNEEENEDGNTPLFVNVDSSNDTNHFTVYDSEYYGVNYMFTRSDKPVSFVMDQPGAEGVEFD